MTIQGALDMADQLKPNMMSRAMKIAFLNELDGKIHTEVIMTHAHAAEEETLPVYDTETDPGTELLIPSPYDGFYPYWIMSRIDELNQEMDKYNNDRALFENKYQEATDWINRTRMPVRLAREIMI